MAATGGVGGVRAKFEDHFLGYVFDLRDFTYFAGFWERFGAISGIYVITPLVPFNPSLAKHQRSSYSCNAVPGNCNRGSLCIVTSLVCLSIKEGVQCFVKML